MFKRFIPYAYARNIYDIEIDFFLKHNIKILFLDLDNTLDSYKASFPSKAATEYVQKLKLNNITPIILSNNTGKRVGIYADKLGIEHLSRTGKPFPFGINKFVKKNNFNKDEIMMIGDQLITDIRAANSSKIKSIYVEKLVKEDQFTTRFNRLFERPIKKYLMNHNKFIEWRKL